MHSQVVLLIAQFGGGGGPSIAWPDYILIIVTALAIAANIAFTLMVVRPRYSLRALLFTLTVVAVMFGLVAAVVRRPIVGRADVLEAARQWMKERGQDPSASKQFVDANEDGWEVFIEYQPPTVGAFTSLRMDSEGKIVKVDQGF
jgi:hypothetical protein